MRRIKELEEDENTRRSLMNMNNRSPNRYANNNVSNGNTMDWRTL